VLDAMLPFLRDSFGNANSIHELGRRSRDAVEAARAHVAELIGAEDPTQIVFTSGATEGNNWFLSAYPQAWVSPFEHASIHERAGHGKNPVLPNCGWEIAVPAEAKAVSLMLVNNETGTIWDPPAVETLHTDMTQAAGKIPVDLTNIAFASMSAHKFYGPKGIGAFYWRDFTPEPFMLGGEHEDGARAGTLNVPGIVGMGEAARIAKAEMARNLQHVLSIRAAVLDEFRNFEGVHVNGGPCTSPYILSMSFEGVVGETLVVEMDKAGFCISSASACSSRSHGPSYVLGAAGVPPELARGTVRLSFGHANTLASAHALASALGTTVERLRKL
jgi:cysteine desulfurase